MLGKLLWKFVERFSIPCRVIHTNGDPYLSRFYLWDKWREYLPGVFLHYFHRGDDDRDLHNHPWSWAFSVILSGGYREERLEDEQGNILTRTFLPGAFNFIRLSTYHRVDLLRPEEGCWSLFIAGPRARTWGFRRRETGEFVDWRNYVVSRGDTPMAEEVS